MCQEQMSDDFFFFKQREETQYIRTYEASLACSFSFATRSTQTLFHPSQALILLTQAISGSQLKFRAIFFFFFFLHSKYKIKKIKSAVIGNRIQGLRKQCEQLSKYSMLY